jgi:hypothetical protein
MDDPAHIVVFEGNKYWLSGGYYVRTGPRRAPLSRPTIYLHRAMWESHYGPIPEGCQIHHKDGNSLNNAIDNLQCIERRAHRSLHSRENYAAKPLPPPSALALQRAAEWHASPEGLEWHQENGRRAWEHRVWHECICQQCGQPFLSPYPTLAKWCHPNCKAENLRQRRGRNVGVRPYRRKPRVLSGKRDPC